MSRDVAVCMAKNEAEIIGRVLDHLWAQEVDEIIVEDGHSTDDTVGEALAHGAKVVHEESKAWDQQAQLTALAGMANPGDWVVPFDADEFWFGNYGTLAETLHNAPVDLVAGHMYLYRNLEYRRPDPKPLPKYAFRWRPGVIVADGAHIIKHVPGHSAIGITIRELN